MPKEADWTGQLFRLRGLFQTRRQTGELARSSKEPKLNRRQPALKKLPVLGAVVFRNMSVQFGPVAKSVPTVRTCRQASSPMHISGDRTCKLTNRKVVILGAVTFQGVHASKRQVTFRAQNGRGPRNYPSQNRGPQPSSLASWQSLDRGLLWMLGSMQELRSRQHDTLLQLQN